MKTILRCHNYTASHCNCYGYLFGYVLFRYSFKSCDIDTVRLSNWYWVPFVIHVTNRFREALTQNNNPVEAAITTLRTTGGSLFGSAYYNGRFWNFDGFNFKAISTNGPGSCCCVRVCLSSNIGAFDIGISTNIIINYKSYDF